MTRLHVPFDHARPARYCTGTPCDGEHMYLCPICGGEMILDASTQVMVDDHVSGSEFEPFCGEKCTLEALQIFSGSMRLLADRAMRRSVAWNKKMEEIGYDDS